LSLADGKIDKQPGNLEGEFDLLGGIDASGKNAATGVLTAGDDEGADGADEFRGCFGWTRAGGEQADCGAAEEGTKDRSVHWREFCYTKLTEGI
jgi:hypothetical protein